MNQHRVQQITNTASDESEMRTRQKRIVTPGEPQGVKQFHWNTGAKENHQLNPKAARWEYDEFLARVKKLQLR